MFKNSYLWLLVTAVLLLTVQVLAVVIHSYSFIPIVWDDPFLKGVEPERETFFYGVFLVTSVVLMALGVELVLPKLSSPDYFRKFKFWLWLEALWCFLMVFYFFKWTTFRYPFYNVLPYENQAWLQPFFYAVCFLALLSKIFFPEIVDFYTYLQTHLGRESYLKKQTIFFQLIFIVGIVILLYIPRPQDVAALSLAWDQWNHLDRVAGWFIKNGWYLNYENIIQILVVLAIAYIVGIFYFIRLWLDSWLLAVLGALLVIKFGMFYYGSAPCIWMDPANTFLAHGWDLALFFGLWYVSLKHPKRFYAAAITGAIVLVVVWLKSNGGTEALGLDNQPMFAPLRVRQFFPFFMGYFVPLFYVFSLLILMGKPNAQSSTERRWPIVLCIYGLMIFVGYLEHPMIGFYGSLMVPAILVMLWWFKRAKRGMRVLVLLLATGALLTNRLMMTYPNIIFQDKARFSHERAFYEHFDAIAKSAALIQQLTKEDQKVALLSNFETALLMQAHRQPLFSDFPVMFSSFANGPGGLNLITKKQGLDLINSLTDENALYVFVDERLLALSPQVLGNSGLNAVLSFVNNHYIISAHQGFLAALQRR